MYLRVYTVNQKYIKNKYGDIGFYKKKVKKWIKSNKPYKPQKRGPGKQSIYSKRFGLLDLYNRKEQQGLICPSGFSIGQCFNVMSKMWYGYHKARRDEKNCETMLKYARAIQNVQEDMGIKITSFQHLGLDGDALILNDQYRHRKVCNDYLELKKDQQKYEKLLSENAKKIQKLLQKPDKDKGQKIVTIADDVYPHVMQYNKKTVPNLLKPDYEKGESLLTIADNVSFKTRPSKPHRRKCRILPVADVYPDEMNEADAKQTVPNLLKPDYEKDEDSIVFTDDIPFER